MAIDAEVSVAADSGRDTGADTGTPPDIGPGARTLRFRGAAWSAGALGEQSGRGVTLTPAEVPARDGARRLRGRLRAF